MGTSWNLDQITILTLKQEGAYDGHVWINMYWLTSFQAGATEAKITKNVWGLKTESQIVPKNIQFFSNFEDLCIVL